MVEAMSISMHHWLSGPEILGIAAAYALGCLTTGYYLVRWRTGQDIHGLGSGNVGARNVGRMLGPGGFALTFVGALAKGLVSVLMAKALGFRLPATILVMIAVVVGHNWPVQLGFRGGKGIATSAGAILAFDPLILLGMVLVFLVLYAWWRKFTLSGLLAFVLLPLLALVCRPEPISVIGLTLLAGLVLAAHHHNLRDEWGQIKIAAKG